MTQNGDDDERKDLSQNDNRSSSSEYPEVVEFSGIGHTSLLQVHISAGLIILVGVILAVEAPPEGLFALIAFLLFVLGVEMWMIRKSQKKLRLAFRLRENPVVAYQGDYKVGNIDHGTIETEMENPTDLGYRPAPKKNLIVWTFDSEEDKQIVAKRLLEYLSRDS